MLSLQHDVHVRTSVVITWGLRSEMMIFSFRCMIDENPVVAPRSSRSGNPLVPNE